ncbi:hypothetical protein [Filimonas effusa]|uniref:T9SS C-terminal target domain-containing protein n=1 Tax=Filimonas effusa TaxID=2508721 RepID=A0A4Q1D3B5_9BACT|nr:hypothetical protein [Filimonas effusa]RXK82900.1 hypothetical protein ESB13_12285 [Filimonas effusa]
MKKMIFLPLYLMAAFFSSAQTPSLQQVTETGNVTDRNINVGTGTNVLTIGAKVLQFYNAGSSAGIINVADDNNAIPAMLFAKSGNYVASSFPNGNVGIGTTSPTQKLEVAGKILANASDGGFQIKRGINHNEFSAGENGEMVFYQSASAGYPIWIKENANVGIGTTSPAYKLDVNGDIKMNDANTFHGASFQTNDYSAMVFQSRAWSTVQGANGKAFSFQTHNNVGNGGFEMMGIYYGENGKLW